MHREGIIKSKIRKSSSCFDKLMLSACNAVRFDAIKRPMPARMQFRKCDYCSTEQFE